jgi:hypothetical protein
MTPSLHTKFKRADQLIATGLDEAMIISSLEDDKFYGLNKVASRIWQLLEEPVAIEEIVTSLLNQFEIDRPNCETQVKTFVSEMLKANIIVEVH